ncbi:ATP-binding protein [Sphingomonas sp. DT-207]|uniref:ATP-binding protein n=1 Tax=Sphingomonas sp. DT-207 TaxID=3396167 RepID=UPI003F1CD125
MRLRELSMASRPLLLLLWSGTFLLLALLGTVVVLELGSERDRAETSAIRENQNRAIAFEQFVTRTFEAAELAATHLGPHYIGHVPPGSAPRAITDPVARNPLFAGVVIADAAGNIGWTTFGPAARRNVADGAAFRALQGGTSRYAMVVGDPLHSPTLGRAVIPLTHAIRDHDGSFGGIVTILIPVQALTGFNQGADLRALDLISVLRLDGMTLARRTGGRVTWGEDLAGRLVMQRQLADPNASYLGPNSVDGTMRYFSQRRIPRYGIFATAGVGQADVLRPVERRARIYWGAFALLALAVVAFSGALSWALRRRDRAVAAMAQSNARLHEAQRLGRIGDWTFEIESDRLIWSEHLCEMFGRDPADNVLSRDEALAYLDPTGRAELLAMIDAVCETREARECEVTVRESGCEGIGCEGGGRESCHRIRVMPLRAAGGPAPGLFATVQDITAEKRHERLRDEVAQIARVEAMNMVGATAVHELSQPLTAASNYVAAAHALAVRQAPGDAVLVVGRLEEAGRHIGFTRNIVQRVRDMVSDRTDMVPGASVRDIVQDAIALVWLAAPGWKGEIAQRLGVVESRVAADQIQVQQVLLNLLRNACQAAAHTGAPQIVLSSALHCGESILFAVEDNGPGIAPELGDIFSPFASSKRDGLGLGLAVSRAIVQSYGGRMWVDHAHAPGARICFTLPLEK